MPCERLERQSLGENVGNIVKRVDVLDDNVGRRKFGAEPMILHGERLGSGRHAWRISGSESQSWSVVFKYGRKSADAISKLDIKDRIELEEQTAQVEQRPHSHA